MSSSPRGWVDAALALLLFVVTVAYLGARPLYLSVPDEAHALHEAKRVLDGDSMYRDIFELVTPGWIYLMALLFHVFGTTLSTARATAAVIDGGIAVLTFVACRQLGVRRELAWACGLAYLVVCQPLYPVATQHWLSTFLSVALLCLCLRSLRAPFRGVATGVVVGLIIAVHQHRGISMGLGVTTFLVVDALICQRYLKPPGAVVVLRQLLAVGVGVSLVVVPLVIGMVVSAGVDPVWRALVVHPLVNYRAAQSVSWGQAMWKIDQAPYAFPRTLTCLPVLFALTVPRALVLIVQRRDLVRARALTLVTILCLCSMLSIAYRPDLIHIAFIGALFFVAVGESIEWGLRLVPTPVGRGLGVATAAIIILAGAVQLQQNLTRLRAQHPLTYMSEFGEVALTGPRQMAIVEQLRALVRSEPSRTLYCHPMALYTYLLVGANNPTRFDLVLPPLYTGPDQVQEIVDTLAAKRVPYVLTNFGRRRADDPISRFILEHYERRSGPQPLAHSLWYRKGDAGAPPPM